MKVSMPIVTESYLRSVTLPNHANSYTVISHGFIIDNVKQQLANNNLTILNESYKIANNGDIAQGSYVIKPANDTDLGILFSWVNSYNKKVKFQCIAGATASPTLPYSATYIPGNIGSFVRKHTGNADQEAIQHIHDQINQCSLYYNTIVRDHENFSKLILGKEKHAEILGLLYFIDKLLTPTQSSTIVNNIKDPLLPSLNSLWDLYTHVSIALRKSHPLDWISNHIAIHTYMNKIFKSLTPVSELAKLADDNPNQLDLFDTEAPVKQEITEVFYDL